MGPKDPYPRQEDIDEGGNVWCAKVGDDGRYLTARDGDHLVTPFQCELCLFRSFCGRDPNPKRVKDRRLLRATRRASIDAFWAREPSTVDDTRRQVAKTVELSRELGKEPSFESLGPFPLEDVLGVGAAVDMLTRSLDRTGKYKATVQVDTARRVRMAYNNVYRASVRGQREWSTVGFKVRMELTRSPCQSEWWTRFMKGIELRMGVDVRPDKALSIEVMIELQRRLQLLIATSTGARRRLYVSFGAYLILSYGNALRGNEGYMVDLYGTRADVHKGKDDDFVTVSLLGRFKGEQGFRCHKIPMASSSESGLEYRWWIEQVISAREEESRNSGPMFCNSNGRVADSKVCERLFHRLLEGIQKDRPDLIDPDEDIFQYGLGRSMRRGAETRARVALVPPEVVDTICRWRTIERAKGARPKMKIRDHYSDVIQLAPLVVEFSRAL